MKIELKYFSKLNILHIIEDRKEYLRIVNEVDKASKDIESIDYMITVKQQMDFVNSVALNHSDEELQLITAPLVVPDELNLLCLFTGEI